MKFNKRKIGVSILVATVFFSLASSNSYAGEIEEYKISKGKQVVSQNLNAFKDKENNDIYIDIRKVFEGLGHTVRWVSSENKIRITKGSLRIEVDTDSGTVEVRKSRNDISEHTGVFKVVEGSNKISVNFLSDTLGIKVKDYPNLGELRIIDDGDMKISKIEVKDNRIWFDVDGNYDLKDFQIKGDNTSLYMSVTGVFSEDVLIDTVDSSSVIKAVSSKSTNKRNFGSGVISTNVKIETNKEFNSKNYTISETNKGFLVEFLDSSNIKQNSEPTSETVNTRANASNSDTAIRNKPDEVNPATIARHSEEQSRVMEQSGAITGRVTYTQYNTTFQDMLQRQQRRRMSGNSASNLEYHLNPKNIKPGTQAFLQFLDLRYLSGVTAEQLNTKILVNKGVLTGQGEAFVEAGRKYGVNEAYLVAHAFLETGHGRSELATGINWNGRMVYNMYGIGAIDSNPRNGGASFAYNNGWFTPEEAIIGGAKFVKNSYIDKGQNTIYEMRWNPDVNRIWHQYASDVAWAAKQVSHIDRIYRELDSYVLNFDIPVYKD